MPARTPRPEGSAFAGHASYPGRAVIDQAIGVLIFLYRVDAERGFWILYSWARDTDASVLTVARTLVHAVCLEDTTREWDRDVRRHVEAALAEVRPLRLPGSAAAHRGRRLGVVE